MAIAILKLGIVALNTVMAIRAFQSGSYPDRLLGATLVVGLILLFTAPVLLSTCWLIACACAYLTSQILTSARLLSRVLPILSGLFAGLFYWI